MDEVCRRFRTPRALAFYMSVSFRYIHDFDAHGVEEHWKLPHETLTDGFGDCEDYSLFAWHVLRQNGYDVRLFAAFTDDQGHAVCLFVERGAVHSICNEGIRRDIAPEATWSSEDDLARSAAARIFRTEWSSCSFVTQLTVAEETSGRYLPRYEWIHRAGT